MMQYSALSQYKKHIVDYLARKGIDSQRPFLCLNPEHDDTRPSMHLDVKRNKVHCFACGADYDTIDLLHIDTGLSGPELFKKAQELFGGDNRKNTSLKFPKRQSNKNMRTETDVYVYTNIHTTEHAQNSQADFDADTVPYIEESADYTDYYKICQSRIHQTKYPQSRGLTEKTITPYNLGFDPAWKHPKKADNAHIPTSPRLIIPTNKSSYIARDTRANLTGSAKDFAKMKVGAARNFNLAALKTAESVIFVVEAELDALSVIDAGGEAIGLGSTSGVRQFLEAVAKNPPKHALVLALDNDDAGNKATQTLQVGLEALHIPFYKSNISGIYKDPSEALERDREALQTTIAQAQKIEDDKAQEAKRVYEESSVANQLDAFIRGIDESVHSAAMPTGFAAFDTMLDGGLYEGLYIMGAISSLGKTSFALQLVDQIAQSGTDCLVFSLEMATSELMAKSISRITMQELVRSKGNMKHAKTVRGILDGKRYKNYSSEEHALIQTALAQYKDYGSRIFMQEGFGNMGVADIRERVEKHIAVTGNKPFVVVDYLQILAPHNVRATDKQNIDKAVIEIKRISRDFRIPVLVISSFNRTGYNETVKMEGFKESGVIEYSADVLIGLQLIGAGQKDFNVDEAKKKKPREVELVLLKNRNGASGEKIHFKYYAAYNAFV